jgi:predicted nucleic acid-binding protein
MFFTDVEVFQELLHRYLSMRTWTSVQPYVRDLLQVMAGRIEPVEESDVQQAMALADELQDIDARDLLHAAVMTRVGARRICSADRGFDRLPGIERLDPALVEEWERLLEAPES